MSSLFLLYDVLPAEQKPYQSAFPQTNLFVVQRKEQWIVKFQLYLDGEYFWSYSDRQQDKIILSMLKNYYKHSFN